MIVALALLATGAPEFAHTGGVKLACLENLRGKVGRARVDVVVGAGALHEDEEERGVAHLVEHLLMRPLGFDDKNAATGWDYTAYHHDVRAAELSTAAIDLVRALQNLDLEGRAFELEREIVLRELELRGSRESQLGADPIFGGTLLARDPGGTERAVRSLTPEHVRAFHARHYVRGNIAVSLRGAVSCAAAAAALAPHLAAFPEGGPAPIPRVDTPEPGPRALSAAHAGGETVLGFYWYDATLVEEVGMQLLAKHLEQRALDELRKSQGLTYSPEGRVARIGRGGMMNVRVVSGGAGALVAEWFARTIDEVRASERPKALMKSAEPYVMETMELDAARSSLAALHGEPAPAEVLSGLDDASLRAALATMLAPERAFGTTTPSSSVTSIVILVLFGAAVLGVIGYVGLMLMRSR